MKSFVQSLALIATLVLLALGEEVSRPLNPPHQFAPDFSKKLTPLKTKAVTLSTKDSLKAIVYPVVVYEHANFEGVSGGLDVGRYDYLSFGLANDVLSSLTVRDGFVVTLYKHINTPICDSFGESVIIMSLPHSPVLQISDEQQARRELQQVLNVTATS
jgi:hypothetical protein